MIKFNRVSTAIFKLDFERDIVASEEKLINEFGFLKEEVNFVMRYNPKFILLGETPQTKGTGINVLKKFFVDEKGFDMDTLRTLVVRYPYVLSKTTSEFNQFFETLKGQDLTEEEIMKALLECPKLVSKKDLPKQIKEI